VNATSPEAVAGPSRSDRRSGWGPVVGLALLVVAAACGGRIPANGSGVVATRTPAEDVEPASAAAPDDSARIARLAVRLDSLVPAEMAAAGIPGAAVAVVWQGRIVYARGFGRASVEEETAVTPETLFRIASTTKVLTAAALLSASDRGLLDIDRPVGDVVSGLSPSLGAVPVRDLLRHRAGLRESSSYFGAHDEAALGEFVRSWSDSVFFAAPGEVYSYSNLGYVLAGAALEAVARTPYADAMAEHLFRPMGMRRSTLRPLEAMTYPLAQGHEPDAEGRPRVVRPFSDNVRYWPAGSAFTTASDYARLLTALLDGGRIDGRQALPEPVVRALLTVQTPVPGNVEAERAGYSFGLIARDVRGVRMFQHGGIRIGFGSVVRLVPEHRFGIVVLANRTSGVLLQSVEAATETLVPLAPLQPPGDSARALTPAEASGLAGRYVNAPGVLELELRSVAGELRLVQPGVPDERGAVVTRFPDGRLAAGGQTFAVVPGRSGRERYLVISGRALRRVVGTDR
jgi:CubicO group peptidase (beta-lactamase class C family)